ncbi:class F sortase [Streptomyces sp. NPDC050161]|uniref:class F sortase n=1 Tax=Streptomyces sp. NPDC050161 TaxID=3365604 RepID=UPI0037B0106F
MAPPNQQPPSKPRQTGTAPRPFARALMWPAVAAGMGALLVFNSFDTSADAKPPAPPAAVAPAAPNLFAPTTGPTTEPKKELELPRSAPKRLSIPEIGVDAPFTPLSIGAKGQLNAPPPNDSNLAGWFKDGATPGERGASIVAGHVDTKTGPAVFLRLDQLKAGSTADITRNDGSVATFTVDSVETFSKANFPDERVYADTPTPQLRLITCGGVYDRAAKDYVDNVVVFAHLTSTKKAS